MYHLPTGYTHGNGQEDENNLADASRVLGLEGEGAYTGRTLAVRCGAF